MHAVQFFLQIFHLLFDRRFAVQLLVVFLLRALGLCVNAHQLQIFKHQLLRHVKAGLQAVLFQKRIPLGSACSHPRGEGTGHIPQIFPSLGLNADHLAPLVGLSKINNVLFDLLQPRRGLFPAQVFPLGTPGHAQRHGAVWQDRDFVNMDTVFNDNTQISRRIDLRHRAGCTDGIKTLRGHIFTGGFFFQQDKRHALARCGFSVSHGFNIRRAQVHMGTRQDHMTIDRHYGHGIPSLDSAPHRQGLSGASDLVP